MATDTLSFLSVTEAARLLGLSSDSIRYYTRLGRLHGIRVGNQHIFLRQELERFQQQQTAKRYGCAARAQAGNEV